MTAHLIRPAARPGHTQPALEEITMTLPQTDDHVQHTWILTNDASDRIIIDLWVDDYTVAVDGGPDDGDQREGGRADIDHLLAKYQANGYRLVSDYAVNDAAVTDGSADEDWEPDDRPEACPMCGCKAIEYVANHCDGISEGPAWLCTGCRWGQFVPRQP